MRPRPDPGVRKTTNRPTALAAVGAMCNRQAPRWVYWRECASASGEEVPDAPEKDRRTDDGKATGCHGGDGKCRNVETVRGPEDQKRHVARDSARKQQDKEGRSRSKEDLSHERDGHRLTQLLTCPRANGCRRQKRQCQNNRAPFHSSVRLEPGQASACPPN